MNTYPNAMARIEASAAFALAADAAKSESESVEEFLAAPASAARALAQSVLRGIRTQALQTSLRLLSEALVMLENDDQLFAPRDPNALTWKQKRERKAERKKLRPARIAEDPLLRRNSGFGYETTRRNGGLLPPPVRKWLAVNANERTASLRDLALNHESVLAHLREPVVLP